MAEFPTTADGHDKLLSWLADFGAVARVGVEGTGSYGAGLARYLRRCGVQVVEVDRPNRQARRRTGKSDTIDAIEAARAAQGGRALGAAKTRDGNVEAIRRLVVARRSARSTKIKTLNQSATSASPPLTSSASAWLVCNLVAWPKKRRRCGPGRTRAPWSTPPPPPCSSRAGAGTRRTSGPRCRRRGK